VPGMTQEQTIEWFRSGRICGIALENIIANQFDNTSSDETTQGESPDLWVTIDGALKTVQVKTTNRMDFKNNKIQKATSNTKIRVGKSSLFDSKSRRTAEEIQNISDKYFSQYDYFMVVEITHVYDWCYSFILIPTKDLELIDAENVKYQSIFNKNRTIIDLPFKDKE